MTTPFPSPAAPESRQFSLTGVITTWDPFGRWIRMGERNLWVAPGVVVAGLAPGALVALIGYQDDVTGRWIVTQLRSD